MKADKTHVIVSSRCDGIYMIPTALVRHRQFQEVSGSGPTPADAAEHLITHLMCAQSSVGSGWRRDRLDQAVADVYAFIEDLERSEARQRSSPPAPAVQHASSSTC